MFEIDSGLVRGIRMSRKCSAKTKGGNLRRAAVVHGTRFCALHGDPARAAELGRMGGLKNRHYVDPEAIVIPPPSTPEDFRSLLAGTATINGDR